VESPHPETPVASIRDGGRGVLTFRACTGTRQVARTAPAAVPGPEPPRRLEAAIRQRQPAGVAHLPPAA